MARFVDLKKYIPLVDNITYMERKDITFEGKISYVLDINYVGGAKTSIAFATEKERESQMNLIRIQ